MLDFAAQVLGVPRESVSTATAYETIPEWDGVMHLRLVMEIQDRFGVDIPIERVPDLKTLGDFFSLLLIRPAEDGENALVTDLFDKLGCVCVVTYGDVRVNSNPPPYP